MLFLPIHVSRLNHNVRLALLYTFIGAVTWGISYGTVLSGYLYDISGSNPKKSNRYVGLAEGIQGVACLVGSLPAGVYADKYGRAPVLKIAGIVGIFSTVWMFFAVLSPWKLLASHKFVAMCIALGFSGLFRGIWSSPLESIFADSVITGERSTYSTAKFSLALLGRIVGPILSIIIVYFSNRNNVNSDGSLWTKQELTVVLLSGVGIGGLCALILFFFSDEKTLDRASTAHTHTERLNLQPINSTTNHEYHTIQSTDEGYNCFCRIKRRYIPRLAVLSDFIMAIASGMTIKFFPLFFKNMVGLSVIQVQLVYVTTFILMTIFATIARNIAKKVGRVHVAVTCSSLGILLLITMAIGTHFHILWFFFQIFFQNTWYIVVPVYVIRTALMNCCAGLKKSIIMDFVSKSDRGKWNALDGVTKLGWSGSALVGGLIIDKLGYGATFAATAFLQFAGMSVWMLLLPLVPIECKIEDVENVENNNNNSYRQPSHSDFGTDSSSSIETSVNEEK